MKKRKPAPADQSPMLLQKELAFYGVDIDPESFNELIAALHSAMHPAWNPEQLLYHPTYGATFVCAVRARTKYSLPEEMILRRLRNLQKAGKYEAP